MQILGCAAGSFLRHTYTPSKPQFFVAQQRCRSFADLHKLQNHEYLCAAQDRPSTMIEGSQAQISTVCCISYLTAGAEWSVCESHPAYGRFIQCLCAWLSVPCSAINDKCWICRGCKTVKTSPMYWLVVPSESFRRWSVLFRLRVFGVCQVY